MAESKGEVGEGMQGHVSAAAQELRHEGFALANALGESGPGNPFILHQGGDEFRRFEGKRLLLVDAALLRILQELALEEKV